MSAKLKHEVENIENQEDDGRPVREDENVRVGIYIGRREGGIELFLSAWRRGSGDLDKPWQE